MGVLDLTLRSLTLRMLSRVTTGCSFSFCKKQVDSIKDTVSIIMIYRYFRFAFGDPERW